MLQLQLQPAYCLTNHKVQALTIRHTVDGCLEVSLPTDRSTSKSAVSWTLTVTLRSACRLKTFWTKSRLLGRHKVGTWTTS